MRVRVTSMQLNRWNVSITEKGRYKKMIKLSTLTEASLSISSEAHSALQWSDKALFEYIYQDYKSVSKGSRGRITTLLNQVIASNTESTNVQNALKKVCKVAFNYVDMQVITKFDGLEYDNIDKLVKLFKYVDKHITDKSKELRDKVKEVHEQGMSPYRYNNNMSSLITSLKEEYKLKEQEDEFVFIDMFNMIQQNITKMTDEQLTKLIELAQRNMTQEAA